MKAYAIICEYGAGYIHEEIHNSDSQWKKNGLDSGKCVIIRELNNGMD